MSLVLALTQPFSKLWGFCGFGVFCFFVFLGFFLFDGVVVLRVFFFCGGKTAEIPEEICCDYLLSFTEGEMSVVSL